MSDLSFPIAEMIAVSEVPDELSIAQCGRLVRSAVNAVAAQRALKRTVRSPAAYAQRVARRGVEAWLGETWEDWAREHAEEEQRLERLSPDPSMPELAALMPLLLVGHDFADPRVPRWTRLVLGHAIGEHEADCDSCKLASDGRWDPLLRNLGVQPRSLANYWSSLVAQGFADHSIAVLPMLPNYQPVDL